VAADDGPISKAEKSNLRKHQKERKDRFYSDLLFTLTHLRKAEEEASLLWGDLLQHKKEMSDTLGRKVGIRVAALDFFQNITRDLGDVKIIEDSKYVETARLAVTDGLTQLFNHRYCHDRLERTISNSDSNTIFSVFMFDIDNFKNYNDTNGHIAGDVVLREVGLIVHKSIRSEDIGCRYGGEEFCIILINTGREQAFQVAERIRINIEKKNFPNVSVMQKGSLTISGGIATFPEDALVRPKLLEVCDKRLYQAKNNGKNMVIKK
jgi:diguanylate cyclase (GGDEF)-like protein